MDFGSTLFETITKRRIYMVWSWWSDCVIG